MKLIDNLWYSKKEDMYYMLDTLKLCPKCQEPLIDKGMYCLFVRFIGRKFDELHFYCQDCAQSTIENAFAIIEISGKAFLSNFKPKDSILCIRDQLNLHNAKDVFNFFCGNTSGLSVFDVDEINKLGGSITDNTKFANRSETLSLMKSEKEILKLCEKKDQETLSIEDLSKLNKESFGKPLKWNEEV